MKRILRSAAWLFACVFMAVSGVVSRPAVAAMSIDVTLPVTQYFTQPAGVAAEDTFTYALTAADPSGSPLPAGASGGSYAFTIKGNTTHLLGPITYSRGGLYGYTLKQTANPPKPGYSYDATEYAVTVQILTQSDGSLSSAIVVKTQEDTKVAAVVFSSTFALDPTTPPMMVDPPVNKTVKGSPNTDQSWQFSLTAQAPTHPMPAGSVNGVKTIEINGSGTGEFGTWIYSAPGVYIYTVTENNTHVAGYEYDSTVYTITDYVTAGSGHLELNRVLTDGANKNVTAFDYVNTYAAPVVDPPSQKLPGLVFTGANVTALAAIMGLSMLGAGICFFLLFLKRRRREEEGVEEA